MHIPIASSFASGPACRGRRSTPNRASGSAILVVLTVLALMTILLIANARVVWHLNREIRLVEKRQLQRELPAGPRATRSAKPVQPNPPVQ